MRLDVCVTVTQVSVNKACVLPSPLSVPNLHNLQRDIWDLDFENWVVAWVFSLLNGLPLTQVSIFFLTGLVSNEAKHMASDMENVRRVRSVLRVLLNTTQSRSESPLTVNQKELILQRDTERKQLENWHRVLNYISCHLWKITLKDKCKHDCWKSSIIKLSDFIYCYYSKF